MQESTCSLASLFFFSSPPYQTCCEMLRTTREPVIFHDDFEALTSNCVVDHNAPRVEPCTGSNTTPNMRRRFPNTMKQETTCLLHEDPSRLRRDVAPQNAASLFVLWSAWNVRCSSFGEKEMVKVKKTLRPAAAVEILSAWSNCGGWLRLPS